MGPSKDSAQIEATAATWLAKRESGSWSAFNQAELDTWLDDSIANRIAYIRLHAAWEHAGRLNALGAGVARGTIPARNSWGFAPWSMARSTDAPPFIDPRSASPALPARHFPTHWRYIAASVVLAAVVGAVWHMRTDRSNSYSTRIGAVSTVPLPDGSRITLNTNSEIHVALSPKQRRIELDHGEAFFEVAHDATRPFIVEIADKRVVAVGTKFSIRREDKDIQVLVTEGRVRIERIANDTKPPQTQLAAGSEARTSQTAVLVDQPSSADIDQWLSWRTGYVKFRDVALADAVADFNRYSTRKIVIDDPQVAALRVGGNFRSDNVDAFIALIQSSFPVHVEQQSDRIVLTKR
jgi:transmembrane sensor